ncbi:MAG: lipopolysaccharide biosynthesis protein [Roseateles sp.]
MDSSQPELQAAGRFTRAVLVLASGTALAHGITAVSMPLLTRIYTPDNFGLLAVFTALLAILSVAACLRYELAITLPEDDGEAQGLLGLSLACCVGLTLMLVLLVGMFPEWLSTSLGQPQLKPFLWLLPLGFLLAGSYGALQFWNVRTKAFGFMAGMRVAQSAGSSGAQVAVGLVFAHPFGLLIGPVLNSGIACAFMGRSLKHALSGVTIARMVELASSYRRFPLYSTGEALANCAAIQLPVILIAAHATPAEAGQLSMAMFVAQAPLSLIGTAISQVYLSRAAELQRIGQLGSFSIQVLGNLARTGAGPLLAAGILAPTLFPLVFGEDWTRSGLLLSWMTPWFLLQFLTVPLSMSLHVCSWHRAAMMLQVGGLVLRVGVVVLFQQWAPRWTSEIYALSGALFYLVYLLIILNAVGATPKQTATEILKRGKPVVAWVLGAAIVPALLLLVRS